MHSDEVMDRCEPQSDVKFNWRIGEVGIGSIVFYIDHGDGYVHCRNNGVSREFIVDMLRSMVDNCVLDDLHTGCIMNALPPGYKKSTGVSTVVTWIEP
jgi:hypothetical protein